MPSPSPPHLPRLLERLRQLEGPLIQLWGWPGTGKRALLAALEETGGERVAWVKGEELADFQVPAEEVSWILCPQAAAAGAAEAAARLLPHQRLVLAGRRRQGGLTADLLGPEELRLEATEVASFLGAPADSDLPGSLAVATDGWLEPLRRIFAAGLPGELAPPLLAHSPGVSTFLRHQVFEPLAGDLQAQLLEVAGGEELEADVWRQVWGEGDERLVFLGRLLAEEGLWVEEGGRRRLPRLLASWLREERRRAWPPERRAATGRRLALAAYGQGRLGQAVSALSEAEDPLRLGRLLAQEWLEIFAQVPAERVAAALRLAGLPSREGGELLAAVGEALGDRGGGGGLDRLQQLSHRESAGPRVVAAAELVVAVLALPAQPAAGLGRRLRRRLGDPADLPDAVESLIRLLEGQVPPAPPPAPEGGLSLARRLLAEGRRRQGPGVRPGSPRLAGAADGPAGPALFQVLFLGTPEVARLGPGGRHEVRWTLRRAFKIFAFLASSPELAATREGVVEAVWADAGEEVVERNFHPTLSHLRKSLAASGEELPSALEFHRGVYRLNPEIGWWIDALELQRRLGEGRSRLEAGDRRGAEESWRAAWHLYRGPFLEGFYDLWVVERREVLSRAYLECLGHLGDLLFDGGDLAGALDAYRSILATDPLQERVHLAVMQIYARQARRDLVRRQYDRLSRLMQEELGVEPLDETTAQFHRLMG